MTDTRSVSTGSPLHIADYLALDGPNGLASRFRGATVLGAPTSGTWTDGDWVIDRTGAVWVCTVAGTPGTWVSNDLTTSGTATLVAGAKVVSTTKVTANSRIFLTVQSLGTVTAPTVVAVTARTAATSFTITSADATDTSVVAWVIVEP